MTISITKPQAIELLERAVAERGKGYVDPGFSIAGGCKYVREEKPSCIIGVVFHYAGVPIDALKRLDAHGPIKVTSPRFLEMNYGIVLDDETHALLDAAQQHQDDGKTWGAAVHEATAEMAEEA